jgi:hypothetical protein
VADLLGLHAAVWAAAAVSAGAAVAVAVRMYETHPPARNPSDPEAEERP